MPPISAFRLGVLISGAVLLAVAGCVTGQASDPAGGVEQAQAGATAQSLASFQRSLEQLRAGKLERVTILQIGDSHTAGDHFSGRLRDLFQEKFGNAGRGMMPAGYPFPYWRPYQVEVAQKGGWTVLSSNRTDYPQVPYGLSGFITRSQRRDDTMTLQAKEGGAFDTVDIDFFRQPRGGHVIVTIDGRRVDDIDTSGPAYELARKSYAVSASNSLELRTRGDGTVDIADWAIYRRERGQIDLVILDLTMPGLSGRDAYQQLLQIDPEVRILFASGYAADEVAQLPKERIPDFVRKPYLPDELAQAVRTSLSRRP